MKPGRERGGCEGEWEGEGVGGGEVGMRMGGMAGGQRPDRFGERRERIRSGEAMAAEEVEAPRRRLLRAWPAQKP